MRRWIDINPTHWAYRDIVEASRIRMDMDGEQEFISGMTYNVFESGKARMIKRFVTIDSQQEFLLPGYVPSPTNPVAVLVGGVEVLPEKTETGKITLSNPLSAGLEVLLITYGSPKTEVQGCREGIPASNTYAESDSIHPHADLKYKADAMDSVASVFDSYAGMKPESLVILGQKLKRIFVDVYPNDPLYEKKIRAALYYKRDCYVFFYGKVYVPFIYNDFPAVVGYNYWDYNSNSVKYTTETIIPHTDKPSYNDRFFPAVQMHRSEFFALMQKMRVSFYNRYTDKPFTVAKSQARTITDRAAMTGKWYSESVLDILEEKFLDGCYVFPLYEDGSFEAETCITRAEVVTYLNRFIEWAIERFR